MAFGQVLGQERALVNRLAAYGQEDMAMVFLAQYIGTPLASKSGYGHKWDFVNRGFSRNADWALV
jgi:hypothetical protein